MLETVVLVSYRATPAVNMVSDGCPAHEPSTRFSARAVLADYVVPMKPDFTGQTARLYARYRRDLPAVQARELAALMGLFEDDVVIDLGCGTGQLAVPLSAHCAVVVGIDPEPQMLAGLHARRERGVMCVLGDDGDLPMLAASLAGSVGAVVVGNALHWMDETVALRACAKILRPGGAAVTLPPWTSGLKRCRS